MTFGEVMSLGKSAEKQQADVAMWKRLLGVSVVDADISLVSIFCYFFPRLCSRWSLPLNPLILSVAVIFSRKPPLPSATARAWVGPL